MTCSITPRDRLMSLELYGYHVFLWRQWRRADGIRARA